MICGSVMAGDWRQEYLKSEGFGKTQEEWKKALESSDVEKQDLEGLYAKLGAEDFPARVSAQAELLRGGSFTQAWLKQKPQSPNPEIRVRVEQILDGLEGPGKLVRDRVVQHALRSLLAEPAGQPSPSTGGMFHEWFGQESQNLNKGYRQFSFEADLGMQGAVKEGRLELAGNRDGDGDQRLILKSLDWPDQKTFPKDFSVSANLAGTEGGVGAWHLGISIGRVRALYHPGFDGGAFRIEQVDTNIAVASVENMGFTPSNEGWQRMKLKVRQMNNGDVELVVTIYQEKDERFVHTQLIPAAMIGKVDQISLDRSGRQGGDALFDDLVIEFDE